VTGDVSLMFPRKLLLQCLLDLSVCLGGGKSFSSYLYVPRWHLDGDVDLLSSHFWIPCMNSWNLSGKWVSLYLGNLCWCCFMSSLVCVDTWSMSRLAVPYSNCSPKSVKLSVPRRSVRGGPCMVTHVLVGSDFGTGYALLLCWVFHCPAFVLSSTSKWVNPLGVLGLRCLLMIAKQQHFCSACRRCCISFPFVLSPAIWAAIMGDCKRFFFISVLLFVWSSPVGLSGFCWGSEKWTQFYCWGLGGPWL